MDLGAGGFKLEKQDEVDQRAHKLKQLEKAGFAGLHGGNPDVKAKLDSMKEACRLSIGEYHSELAEFSYVQLRKNKLPDTETVVQKLCHELSGVCLAKKRKAEKSTNMKGDL